MLSSVTVTYRSDNLVILRGLRTVAGLYRGHMPPLQDINAFAPGAMDARREIIVIDDEAAVLATTVLLLDTPHYFARAFTDPLEALIHAADAEPTCIVVDLKMPGITGLDLVSAFCALRRHAVILVSAYVDVRRTVEAMRTGVDDVLLKPIQGNQLLRAVQRSLEALDKIPQAEGLTFTNRERQVAELIVGGKRTKEIAKIFDISPRTVEFFRTSLMRKTCTKNTAQLVMALAQLGFSER